VTAGTFESEARRRDNTPTLWLSLHAAEKQPSDLIAFMRHELNGLEGWPETQTRPEVFVDDRLRPPGRFNFKYRFLPWPGLYVSVGKRVNPRLTNAAHCTWLEQYWRDSENSENSDDSGNSDVSRAGEPDRSAAHARVGGPSPSPSGRRRSKSTSRHRRSIFRSRGDDEGYEWWALAGVVFVVVLWLLGIHYTG